MVLRVLATDRADAFGALRSVGGLQQNEVPIGCKVAARDLDEACNGLGGGRSKVGADSQRPGDDRPLAKGCAWTQRLPR